MEYLCHKWPWVCSFCRKYNPVLYAFTAYHQVLNKSITTDATSGTASSIFRGVRVAQCLVFCAVFSRSLPVCPFSFGHCIVCPSNYDFWLLICYLQTVCASSKQQCIRKVNKYITQIEVYYFCIINVCPNTGKVTQKQDEYYWYNFLRSSLKFVFRYFTMSPYSEY